CWVGSLDGAELPSITWGAPAERPSATCSTPYRMATFSLGGAWVGPSYSVQSRWQVYRVPLASAEVTTRLMPGLPSLSQSSQPAVAPSARSIFPGSVVAGLA